MRGTNAVAMRMARALTVWLALTVGFSALPAAATAAAPASFVVGEAVAARTDDGTGVNIRDAPDLAARRIGGIPEGGIVQVVGGPTGDDAGILWYLVTDGAVTGYADGDYLIPADAAAPSLNAADFSHTAAEVGRVPILMYHHLDHTGNQYSIAPEQLDAQCQWLVDHGYTAITLTQLVAAAFDGGLLPAQPVALTDDDGWATSMEFAEILGRHGLVGTYFVNNTSQLTPDQIAELAQAGDVEAHTVDHAALGKLAYPDQYAEIADNRSYLEATTGRPIRLLAWPYGDSNASAIQAAADAGIVAAFDAWGGPADLTALDRWHIPRVLVGANDDLASFAAKVAG